jgi:hypothetical protein
MDSGSLLPDGRILYCHDTLEPVIFDPVTGAKSCLRTNAAHFRQDRGRSNSAIRTCGGSPVSVQAK